ncbi:hypothetical protein D9757_013572 [Collybiopsis confluens]|uniref:Uncharacterized protein n=1 Tax=Collybiopsis confluens TaxID=2823264 RepID=A0A8H5FRN9_9AGAR|nr:hypothetical protein D9757_013572 [Collybiopsis confluens]
MMITTTALVPLNRKLTKIPGWPLYLACELHPPPLHIRETAHRTTIVPRNEAVGQYATVKPYYRSLGGWHNQWCYGLLPVEALDRFITLIKNPVNAALIREELKAIEGKLGKTRPTVHLPCPYTHFLLASAFNTDLDNKFTHMASFANSSLSSTMNCWGVQNDDGITIIDITDPFNPSYAFCISPGSISTAREYVYGNYRETIDDSGSEGEDDEERRPNSHTKGNSRKLFAKI